MTGNRVRRNPRDRASMRRTAAVDPGPEASAEVRVLPPGTPLVAVLIGGGKGTVSPADLEALTFARQVAPGRGIFAVVLDSQTPEWLAAAGVDRVATAGGAPPFAMARNLAAGWGALNLSHAVAVDGSTGAETLRRLAAHMDRPIRVNVSRIEDADCLCLEDGGKSERRRDAAAIMIATRGRIRPGPGDTPPTRGEAKPIDLPASVEAANDPVMVGTERAGPDTIPLTEADLVLSAGAGVADWNAFHSVAKALGAAVGGSRVVCDAGHLARDRQVGISGRIIAARCYIALGISGAGQHLQGIEGCRQVIAVNADPHAPIIRRADLAVVADAGAVLHALLADIGAEA